MSASGSVAAGPKRIRLLDVLRGFAILGTLGTNIWIFTAIGAGGAGDGAADKEELAAAALRWWTSLDSVVMQASSFLTNGKFLALLTIMFGVGLELLYQRSRRRNLPWLVPYLWRSAVLFADGVLHFLLVVEFDILMGYAVAAMIVAFLIGRSDRTIKIAMWVSGGLHLLLQGVLGVVFAIFFSDPRQAKGLVKDAVGRDLLAIEDLYLSGSYLDQVAFRWENFLLLRSEAIGIIPMCVFLYLFGAKLVRAGAFAPDEAGSRIRRRLLGWGLAIGIPLNLLPLVPVGHPVFQVIAGLDRYLFAIILAVGYIGLVALFLEKGWLPWLQGRLEDIGKTALSCYVLQNVLGCALFYGWGLGLGRFEVGSLGTVGAWVAISATLALFAHLWLKHFATGPFEMVWRRLSALDEPGRRT